MSNIHANQPHIHLQQHSITHSPEAYHVINRPKPTLKLANSHRKKHTILAPLLIIFFGLITTAFAVIYAPNLVTSMRMILWPPTAQSEATNDQATIAALKSLSGKILFSVNQQLYAVGSSISNAQPITDPSVKTLIDAKTSISTSPLKTHYLLFSTDSSSKAVIIDTQAERIYSIREQLESVADNPIILDVLWEPNQPVVYALISAVQINFRQYFIVRYDAQTNQMQSLPIEVSLNPQLSWYDTNNQNLFIITETPSGNSQIIRIKQFSSVTITPIERSLVPKSNKVGKTIVHSPAGLFISAITEPTADSVPMAADIARNELAAVLWHDTSRRVSLLQHSPQNPHYLTTFTNLGQVVCSITLPDDAQVHTSLSTSDVLSATKDSVDIVSTDTCQRRTLELPAPHAVFLHGMM